MKHLKKQPIAIFLALIIIAGATFFGAHRSLRAASNQVAAQFYEGVYDEVQGRVLPSIYGQLEQRATAALRMISIGEHSHGDDDTLALAEKELRGTRRDLVDLLASGSPGELFEADQAIGLAAERYHALLRPLVETADGEDLDALDMAWSTMQNAARVMRESGYNEAIRAFHRDVLERFPTRFLMEIVFVNPPELFA